MLIENGLEPMTAAGSAPWLILASYEASDTPRFQGMKSFWPNISALVKLSPLGHFNAQIEQLLGACGDGRFAGDDAASIEVDDVAHALGRVELVEILTTGATGLPVGVPRPVVKRTRFAPAPACAVTHSTSLPGVQSRVSPGVVAYCGKSSTSRTGATPPLRAAPADLMASVMRPSSMFPGDGFISKPGVHGLGARRVSLHQVEEALGKFIGRAAIDEFLLHAVQFRKFAEQGFAAELAEQIGEIADSVGWRRCR